MCGPDGGDWRYGGSVCEVVRERCKLADCVFSLGWGLLPSLNARGWPQVKGSFVLNDSSDPYLEIG